MPVNRYEGEPKDSLSINKYEVVYGNLFICRRIIFALSENAVYTYCQEKFPNIFPLKEINLLEEDINPETLTIKE